jgi:tripartite-type tricarboxylate transporter receptor subunit TctC
MRLVVSVFASAFTLASLGASLPALSQAWPTKVVRVVVPHTAGAPFDAELRQFAQSMSQTFGQPFVLENRDGADGAIGAEACARSPADGHTLCATTSSVITLNPLVHAKLPYDPEKDFTPIVQVGVLNSAVIAHPSLPANNFRELIALAKAKPDSITFATMGSTSFGTLLVGWLKAKNGIALYQVPYKNATQAMTAALGGEVQTTTYALGQIVPMVKAGKLKALAIVSSKRSAFLPDVPTLAEEGLDMPIPRNWIGLFAPTGTSREVVNRVNAEVVKVIASPGFRDKFMSARGIEPDEFTAQPADSFAAFLKKDREEYTTIVNAIGLKRQ